jgi:transcriptional regulator with XRE-family HTH domain
MESEIDETATALLGLIGQRLAARRTELRLTLEDVATRTGVSRAMISRIERAEVHASAVVLDKLCAGMGLSLSALFARDTASPLIRRADQPVWQDPVSGYVRREVAPSVTGSHIRIVEVDFPAHTEVDFEPHIHDGIEQHVWLQEGEIEITLGAASYRLSAGDCLYMRLGAGNSFINRSDKPARYVVILTPES